MKIYIDFDGVILDTWDVIFSSYCKNYKTTVLNENCLKSTMKRLGWTYILNNSRIINNHLNLIKEKEIKYDLTILTKINSKEEEKEKVLFLRLNGISSNIICVPYEESKVNYADAVNNILIDDDIRNLHEWENNGGISIFFDEKNNGIDCCGKQNTKFRSIASISDIL